MSNVGASGKRKRRLASSAPTPMCDPALRDLLDHIARELAEEYVRLLEAANAESAPDAPSPSRKESR